MLGIRRNHGVSAAIGSIVAAGAQAAIKRHQRHRLALRFAKTANNIAVRNA